MEYKTWLQIKTKVKDDLDLHGEDFITDDELLGYGNEAIDDIEADVLTLYEDYFLDEYPLPLVTNTSEYVLPSNIYATKIRGLIYANGSEIYPIKRLRDKDRFEIIANLRYLTNSGDLYSYIIKNSTAAAGMKIALFPPSRVTGSYITLWYIRNANKFIDDTSLCDIPEFSNVVIQHIKVRCYEKESHPNLEKAVGDLEKLRKLMTDTLEQMIPDEDTEIQKDMSHYEEMS